MSTEEKQNNAVNAVIDQLSKKKMDRESKGLSSLYDSSTKAVEKRFREHRPSYFSGFEDKCHTFNEFDEILALPFVENFAKRSGFYSYALSRGDEDLALMALYDWDDEYNGCKKWFVVGFLEGFTPKLKFYQDLIAGHKPNCWIRKYQGNKDLLGYDRPDETVMKILKELGWHRDDMLGVACHCDCGYDKKQP